MAKDVKFKAVGNYKGHSVKANGIIELNIGYKYDELVNTILATQLLNENVTMVAKLSDGATNLGSFMIKNIAIDHDGNSTIRYNSNMDHVEADSVNDLARMKNEDVRFMFKASIEEESEEDE